MARSSREFKSGIEKVEKFSTFRESRISFSGKIAVEQEIFDYITRPNIICSLASILGKNLDLRAMSDTSSLKVTKKYQLSDSK